MTDLLNKDDANTCLQFLDRVPVTGHQERAAMNQLAGKLYTLANPQATPPKDTNPQATPPKDTST